jgi:iron complex outermembrane receptor protein
MIRVRSPAPAALAIPILLAATLPLAAQAADSAVARLDTTVYSLPALEVHGSILPSAGPRIGSGIPARISILSRQAIEAWEPRILPDVLASQPGVSLYDDLGTPFKLNLSVRGFTAGPTVGLPPGITVFLDGVRQNEADAQEVDFDLLPMEHIKRVELLSGTASLLGPNSLGGAINLITDRGEGPPHGEIELTGGNYGAFASQASASGLNGSWDWYLSGGYEGENGWRQDTGGKDYNSFLNLGHMGARRGIRLQAFANASRTREAGSLPESIFRRNPAVDFTPGDYDDLTAQQLALSGYAPLAGGQGSFTTYLRRFTGDRFNVNQAPDFSVLASTRNLTAGATLDWRREIDLGLHTLNLRAGLDGSANAVRVRLYDVPPGALIRQGAGPGPADTLRTDVKSPSYDLAGYALADLHLRRLTFSGGARLDYVGIPFHDLLDRSQDQTHSYRRISPRAGASLDLGGSSLYASVGQSFRAPAILELGCADPATSCPLPFALGDDPALRPVRATTYEVGGRWNHGDLSLSASVYRSDVRDEIFFVASRNALLSGYFTNLERTRREGVELSAQGVLGTRISWYANYAYTRATFQSPVDIFSIRSDSSYASSPLAGTNLVRPGDRLPLVPAHQLKAGVLARLTSRLSAGLDGRYIGSQWLRGDEANQTRPLGGYGVLAARAGLDIGRWQLSAVVDNLLDSTRAIFGTFNENRQTGNLERFLTPLNARTFKIILRHQIGGAHYTDTD